MLKIKNLKIAVRHIVTALSALGVFVGFLLALGGKRKTAPLLVFLTSFAGLLAGIGMETKIIPEPQFLKSLEIEIDPDDGEPDDLDETLDPDPDAQIVFDDPVDPFDDPETGD